MSSIARWGYTTPVTVWPILDRNTQGVPTYGAAINFMAEFSQRRQTRRDDEGSESVSRDVFWTEQAGIKRGDKIIRGTFSGTTPESGAYIVRMAKEHDNSMLNDTPDYEVVV